MNNSSGFYANRISLPTLTRFWLKLKMLCEVTLDLAHHISNLLEVKRQATVVIDKWYFHWDEENPDMALHQWKGRVVRTN